MNRSLTEDESAVRGVLVEGLSDADVALLDEFEGDVRSHPSPSSSFRSTTVLRPQEYTRAPCPVRLLDSPSSCPLYAHTYLWTAPLSRLSPQIWSFEAFLRDSAHRWVGAGAESNPDYLEVDRRRNMKGVITPRGVREAAGQVVQEQGEQLKKELDKLALENGKEQENGGEVQFGRKLGEKYWRFAPGYVNLNHGAPQLKSFRLSSLSANPTLFRLIRRRTHYRRRSPRAHPSRMRLCAGPLHAPRLRKPARLAPRPPRQVRRLRYRRPCHGHERHERRK